MKHRIENGIDRIDSILPDLLGARIGLITNQTGIDRASESSVDIMFEKGILSCLFAPEHGIRGIVQAGERIDGTVDKQTGVAVHSLYGGNVHIPKEVIGSLDAVAFDIQDIGARYYTYTSTLSYAMEDCAASGKKMIVFDRPNPIGGIAPEGTVLDRRFTSFVGRYPVASRHNLTVGEYAQYINRTEHIGCDLTVVKMNGWSRALYYDDTDLRWVNSSPNMRSVNAAICYVGTCLAEGTNLSEGRGTDAPFELIGAPWLDAEKTCDAVNSMGLDGVMLVPEAFKPDFSKYNGEICNGIRFKITDRKAFKPFLTAMTLFEHIRKTHTEFMFLPENGENPPFIDLLMGTDEWRSDGFDLAGFLKHQTKMLDEYAEKIKDYYFY